MKKAFERMGPTPEAEDRMLAAILAANATAANRESARTRHGATDASMRASDAPAPDRTPIAKKRSRLLIALPIAACLVIVVGIGVLAVGARTTVGSFDNAADTASELRSASSAPEASESDAIERSGSEAAEPPALPFPIVELEDGTVLRIAESGSGAPAPDEALVGENLGEATAHAADGASAACTVYRYADEQYPYAIRYADDPELHLAAEDEGNSIER